MAGSGSGSRLDTGFRPLFGFCAGPQILKLLESLASPEDPPQIAQLHTLFCRFNPKWCNLLPSVYLLPPASAVIDLLRKHLLKASADCDKPQPITATVLSFRLRRLLPALLLRLVT